MVIVQGWQTSGGWTYCGVGNEFGHGYHSRRGSGGRRRAGLKRACPSRHGPRTRNAQGYNTDRPGRLLRVWFGVLLRSDTGRYIFERGG